MKIFQGKVVSLKMQNTVLVEVERKAQHPIYKKQLKKNKKYKVDTAGFDLKIGDKVKIQETKPLSKDKHFKVLEVLK